MSEEFAEFFEEEYRIFQAKCATYDAGYYQDYAPRVRVEHVEMPYYVVQQDGGISAFATMNEALSASGKRFTVERKRYEMEVNLKHGFLEQQDYDHFLHTEYVPWYLQATERIHEQFGSVYQYTLEQYDGELFKTLNAHEAQDVLRKAHHTIALRNEVLSEFFGVAPNTTVFRDSIYADAMQRYRDVVEDSVYASVGDIVFSKAGKSFVQCVEEDIHKVPERQSVLRYVLQYTTRLLMREVQSVAAHTSDEVPSAWFYSMIDYHALALDVEQHVTEVLRRYRQGAIEFFVDDDGVMQYELR